MINKYFLADEEEEKEELSELYEEAKMPIEDIIMKYKNKIIKNIEHNKESAISKESEDKPTSSKESPISKPKSIGVLDNNCF